MTVSVKTPQPDDAVPGGQDGVESLQQKRRRRTRSEIELAALRLFAERGFYEVTVEDIAASAEISPRTFFRYFPSKEDVLMDRQRQRAERLREVLAARPPTEGPVDALRSAILSLASEAEFDAETRILRAKIMAETPGLGARDLGYQTSLMDPVVNIVATRLGVDPASDLRPAVLVASMIGAAHIAFQMWLARGAGADLRGLVDEALGLVRGGLDLELETRSEVLGTKRLSGGSKV